MTEIEETIKSLEEMFPKGLCEVDEYKMAQSAINALEKQIPKKPKERDCIGFNTLVCPVCKGALYLYEPYCDNCGQKLDWSDSD